MRRLWPLALLALAWAGCGDDPATPAADGRDKAVAFAECMREHGVAAFPDPDASGRLTLDGVVNGSSLNTESATWKRAMDACDDLQPPGFTGTKTTPEEEQYRLRFARCMRDNGIEDFPDPVKDGPLIDTTRIPSAAGRGALDIPGFREATDKCTSVYADELGLEER